LRRYIVAMIGCMAYMVRRERRGAPLFSKLQEEATGFGNGGSKAVELPAVVVEVGGRA
jgi:hypothetical protein